MRRQWSTSTPSDEKLTLAVALAFLKQTNGIQRYIRGGPLQRNRWLHVQRP